MRHRYALLGPMILVRLRLESERLFAIEMLPEVNSNDSLGGPLGGDSTASKSPRLTLFAMCPFRACHIRPRTCFDDVTIIIRGT